MFYKIAKDDFQFIIPTFLILIFFFFKYILHIFNKLDLAYFSGLFHREPYRIFTTHFTHADFGHLLSNIGGIIFIRYFLKELQLKSNKFYIIFMIFASTLLILLQWISDIYLFTNPFSILIGFSGIVYASFAFIVMSSIYGKDRFLSFYIGLVPNIKVKQASLVILGIGFLWSLLPGISLSGHFYGFLAGIILFFL